MKTTLRYALLCTSLSVLLAACSPPAPRMQTVHILGNVEMTLPIACKPTSGAVPEIFVMEGFRSYDSVYLDETDSTFIEVARVPDIEYKFLLDAIFDDTSMAMAACDYYADSLAEVRSALLVERIGPEHDQIYHRQRISVGMTHGDHHLLVNCYIRTAKPELAARWLDVIGTLTLDGKKTSINSHIKMKDTRDYTVQQWLDNIHALQRQVAQSAS